MIHLMYCFMLILKKNPLIYIMIMNKFLKKIQIDFVKLKIKLFHYNIFYFHFH